MSEDHKMTKKDKLVLTITLAAIFFGVFALGFIGMIVNLSSQTLTYFLIPYDSIVANTNNARVIDQEEKNKILIMQN